MKKIVVLQWLLVACIAVIGVLCTAFKMQERELQKTHQELMRSDQAQGRLAALLSGSSKSHLPNQVPMVYGKGKNRFRTSTQEVRGDAAR